MSFIDSMDLFDDPHWPSDIEDAEEFEPGPSSFSSNPDHYHVPLTTFLHDFVTVRGTEKAQLFQGKHPKTGDTVQLWVPRSLLRGPRIWCGFTPTYLPTPLGLTDAIPTRLGPLCP